MIASAAVRVAGPARSAQGSRDARRLPLRREHEVVDDEMDPPADGRAFRSLLPALPFFFSCQNGKGSDMGNLRSGFATFRCRLRWGAAVYKCLRFRTMTWTASCAPNKSTCTFCQNGNEGIEKGGCEIPESICWCLGTYTKGLGARCLAPVSFLFFLVVYLLCA